MTKTLAILLAIASPVLLASTPALATKGIDAARTCEAKAPKCALSLLDDGSIIIKYEGKTIYCTGPQDECHVVIRPVSNPSTPIIDGPKKR